MKRLFELTSLRNGRIYKLNDREIRDFYDNEVMGQSRKPRVIDRLLNLAAEIAGSKLRVASSLCPVGTALLQLRNRYGELIQAVAGANLVVTTGKAAVVDRLQTTSPAVHDYQAIGTGTTSPADGNTALETETGTRVQGSLSQPTSTIDRLTSTFDPGNGTGAITETGRLNASSSGNLFARLTFSAVNKGASDSLIVTHDISL